MSPLIVTLAAIYIYSHLHECASSSRQVHALLDGVNTYNGGLPSAVADPAIEEVAGVIILSCYVACVLRMSDVSLMGFKARFLLVVDGDGDGDGCEAWLLLVCVHGFDLGPLRYPSDRTCSDSPGPGRGFYDRHQSDTRIISKQCDQERIRSCTSLG